MKDELIKILNFKLKHITDNIEELNIINELEKIADVTIALTLDDSDNNMFYL